MNLSFATNLLEVPTSEELDNIQRYIRRNHSLRVHEFRMRTLDEGLILEGRTKTYYGKQLVQHAVMNLTEFPILANNIVVG